MRGAINHDVHLLGALRDVVEQRVSQQRLKIVDALRQEILGRVIAHHSKFRISNTTNSKAHDASNFCGPSCEVLGRGFERNKFVWGKLF